MEKFKIAVIGVGNIAQSHIKAYLSNPDVVSRNARNRNVGPETAQVNYWNIGIRHIVNNVIAGVEIRNYAVAAPAVRQCTPIVHGNNPFVLHCKSADSFSKAVVVPLH